MCALFLGRIRVNVEFLVFLAYFLSSLLIYRHGLFIPTCEPVGIYPNCTGVKLTFLQYYFLTMAWVISFLASKGGVGKSTLASLVACEFARAEWTTAIADMDLGQETSREWSDKRLREGHLPEVTVSKYRTVQTALDRNSNLNLLVFDGSPRADKLTRQIALASDLIVLPSGYSNMDLEPQVRLAHELRTAGIDRKRIRFCIYNVHQSATLAEAQDYIEASTYQQFKTVIWNQTGYVRALDEGKAISETRFSSLNKRALALAEEINTVLVDLIENP